MDNFEQYLQAKKLSPSTIISHCNNVNLFTQWLAKENHLDAVNIGYNDLLAYIQYEKQKNITPATINLRLASISRYFDYLKKLGVSSNSNTVDYFNPQVVSAQDYYPFGMLQPGRSYNTSGYRYGFNGKENDNEVKGEGEQVDYGMRVYDPRVGRFLSVDPFIKEFPELTPYQYASNTPIASIDLDGEESKVIIHVFGTTKNKPILTIVKVD